MVRTIARRPQLRRGGVHVGIISVGHRNNNADIPKLIMKAPITVLSPLPRYIVVFANLEPTGGIANDALAGITCPHSVSFQSFQMPVINQ